MFNLQDYEIDVETVLRNVSPAELYQEALRYEKHATLSDTGALIAYSGDKTGRSPPARHSHGSFAPRPRCAT